jgi:hypothetical protein
MNDFCLDIFIADFSLDRSAMDYFDLAAGFGLLGRGVRFQCITNDRYGHVIHKPKTFENLVELIGERQFNNLWANKEYEKKTLQIETPYLTANVHQFSLLLDPSWSCGLWAEACDFAGTDDPYARINSTYCDIECDQRRLGITHVPTRFVLSIQFSAPDNVTLEPVLDWVESVFRVFFAGRRTSSRLYATVDAEYLQNVNTPFSLRSAAHDWEKWPRALPMLGQYIDGLHPIIVSTGDICRRVAAAVAPLSPVGYPQLSQLGMGDDEPMVSLLRTPRNALSDPALHHLVKALVVPRDETTNYFRLGNGSGEHKVGSQVFLETWRHDELLRARMIPPLTNMRCLPVVHPYFMELLGIDPATMLVDYNYKQNYARDEEYVRNSFESQPSDLPLRQRVWQAYLNRWTTQKPPKKEPFIQYMRDRYFSRS